MTRRTICALALASLLFLPSCFTLGLWGFDQTLERDPSSGQLESTANYDETTEWSWELLGFRLLFTPVTLVLDCATAPIQAWWFGTGEDDDEPSRAGFHDDQRR
jgi:hypothetical protein